MVRTGAVLFCGIATVAVAGTLLLHLGATPERAASPRSTADQATVVTAGREPITPLSAVEDVDPAKVAIGRRLFADRRLSGDGTVSCATCHRLDRGGVDHLPRSAGVGGAAGASNAPTVFNARFNFRQFWDGRVKSLEEQVDGPILNPAEMGASWEGVLAVLRKDPIYTDAFRRAYGGTVQKEQVRHAIAEFERTLVTPDSRFDRFLRGDTSALSAAEQAGYRKFKSYGCVSCHQGVAIGANLYQRMGTMRDYFADRGNVTVADYGRFNVTGLEADRFVFKVPGLRNVAATAPYFHDGSAQTLEQAVAIMASYQLGRSLPPKDLTQIVAFLGTLSGTFEGKPL